MSERGKPWQSEKAAGAFDGVNKAKNIGENFGVVRLLLETNELNVDRVETFVGLDQEVLQKVVHCQQPSPGRSQAAWPVLPSRLSVALRRLISVAGRLLGIAVNGALTTR